MFLPTRTLLIAAALAVCAAPAVAKEIKGAPKVLDGVFADRSEKCADWSENDGFRIEFKFDTYNTCGGQVCEREIISYSKLRNGYVLNERHRLQKGKGRTSPQRIKIIDADTIVYVAPKPTTLHRCPFGDQPVPKLLLPQ